MKKNSKTSLMRAILKSNRMKSSTNKLRKEMKRVTLLLKNKLNNRKRKKQKLMKQNKTKLLKTLKTWKVTWTVTPSNKMISQRRQSCSLLKRRKPRLMRKKRHLNGSFRTALVLIHLDCF